MTSPRRWRSSLGSDANKAKGMAQQWVDHHGHIIGQGKIAMTLQAAPSWKTIEWFNSDPIALEDLKGRVVVLGTFQMLCPGCVSHGLPQLQRVSDSFVPEHVAVIGLHTVFEHHAAMTPVSLEAFLMEYRYRFPVGVDAHDEPDGIPVTMQRYGLRGTPSLVLIDRRGFIRRSFFGQMPDLELGALIAQLVAEADDQREGTGRTSIENSAKDKGTCALGGECS